MRTVTELWEHAVGVPRAHPAYLVREQRSWREVSWDEAAGKVRALAGGFLSLGIERGDRVAILSRSRMEWALCDFALISIGAIVVPIYPTSSTADCAFILADSGARALVFEDASQLAKLAPAREQLEALEHFVSIESDGAPGAGPESPRAPAAAANRAPAVSSVAPFSRAPASRGFPDRPLELDDLAERGRAYARARPDALERARAQTREEDPLTYVYTSGTTGPPKGCVWTQRNAAAMVEMVCRVPDLLDEGDRLVLYLPLAHGFGRLVHFLGAAVPLTIAFCPDVARVAGALAEVRPTILPSVPRLFEKVHSSVRGTFDDATGAKRLLIDWALRTGFRASRRRQARGRLSPGLALQRELADRLVFSKIKARLGGRLRLAVSGGAPLPREVAEFFDALGVLVLEGYGLTECSSASNLNQPGRYRFGTVGPALPGCEVRLGEDGEVLIRGENVFAGYYRNEEATREILTQDGWLSSGDIGAIDSDGFLAITDRKKDIIVTAGGKNVSPQNVENALRASKYVSQSLVIGDRRPFLVALITLEREEVDKVAQSEEEIRALIEQVVATANADLGSFEQVRRFAILPRDFSQEEGELTPTLKLKRRACEARFAAEIEELYGRRT